MALIDKLVKTVGGKVKSSLLTESSFFKADAAEKELPCYITALNILNSGRIEGGLTPGIQLLAGESGVGKTLCAWLEAVAFQKKYKDGIIIFYDSEYGTTIDYMKELGVDINRVIHTEISNIEEFKFDLMQKLQAIEEGEHIFILVDSLGNLASIKEVQDAVDEKAVADMSRAKSFKSLFRMITPLIMRKFIYFVGIQHVYSETGLFAKTVISGGGGSRYASNSAFVFTKSQEKDGTDLTGFNLNVSVYKSRYVREKSRLSLKLLFSSGFQKYSGMFDLLLESGILSKSGNRYQVTDMDTGEIQEAKVWKKDTENSAEFLEPLINSAYFKKWIENRYRLGSKEIEANDKLIDEITDEE